ncbi:putative peptidyl-prolyl cis-trans isomerase D-like protein [Campylobacter sputorum subsp. bubulus]|uniref:Putative peptidyl-prolyl cis-trans isomerase D-like protein n=1 Tax=Campylobacter sputorum subsp. sputorum TaxID=32024 RepID=A0A381DGR0_9BACT|nr:peptidylprolyl isomerase [Campylobacter sputorum]ASM34953.1 putative periplasmic folding chaperone [Campylobacter sputorum aubsp. sputorum RM3237]KAB0581918.1 peptidylprolyl isomerase [Campylobacter sputorum subsp. sputorum]SUX09478.1 putative peptidyl-prolyl cis-trans isomerase D-like protein [Campylobacter sputorum subsp. sputorum]SUX30790.1 putative peptidyl-prolyl cis-trans isomerase D-like protein [Campylobacter sputorum subsp. bubulus]
MITWMQKNKKYLVVTIWISTIAFVGAGFVGWGAYDFNSDRSKSVAKVGHRTVSIEEFQQRYSNFYNYYNNMFDGKFTKEQAEQMGLDNIALQNLIQESLLLNYADDIGIRVSEKDIANSIIKDVNFQKDGVFDRSLYENILKTNGIKPAKFEESLKKTILLQKLFNALNIPSSKDDIEMLASSFFMQDRVAIDVVTPDKNVSINEEGLKKTWEENKNKFQTEKSYELKALYIPSINVDLNETELLAFYDENRGNYRDINDKILEYKEVKDSVKQDYNMKETRKIALEKYVEFKKDTNIANQNLLVKESNATFPVVELENAKANDILKPFEYDNGYLIAKVEKVNLPKPKTYEDARNDTMDIYMAKITKKSLEDKAKKSLENFSGKDIGFISRDTKKSFDNITESEFQIFVSQLFEQTNKKGYILLDKKAIVYEILEQNLLNNNKLVEYKDMLTQSSNSLINDELNSDLVSSLLKRYKIEQYYKR